MNRIKNSQTSGNAYLIEAVDKNTALEKADELLLSIFCENKTGCRVCSGCRRYLKHQKSEYNLIKGGERIAGKNANETAEFKRIITELSIHAVDEDSYRSIIITDADLLHIAVQNAMLKILEEPPPRVLFVLTTAKKRKLLPTILSRCIILKARPDFKNALDGLTEEEGVTAEEARILLKAARNDFNLAKRFKKAGYFTARDNIVEALSRLWNSRSFATSKIEHLLMGDATNRDEAELNAGNKTKGRANTSRTVSERIEKNLEIALIYIQDVLNYKFGIKEIANADRIEDIKRHARVNDLKLTITAEKIAEFIQKIELCKGINIRLGMTDMLFGILEDII